MTDVKYLVIRFMLLGVLIFAIISSIIIIQVDNDVSSENRITNNSLINESYGDLESTLNQQSASENALNSLEEVPPQEYVGDLDVASTVSATRTARNIVVGLWNIYIKLPQVILGVSPVVASAITTILLILIAIAIWALWKGAIS